METRLSLFRFVVISFILAGAVWSDVRSRRIPNSLVLVGLVISFLFAGWDPIVQSQFFSILDFFKNLGLSWAIGLGLYSLRVLGGGDIKLLLMLSPLMAWQVWALTLFFSFVWGSVLGLVKVVIGGDWRRFLQNLKMMYLRIPVGRQQLTPLPFAVAITLAYWSLAITGLDIWRPL